MALQPESEKKELIKKASKELFFRFGFTKTSMDDIARQCGLAKPTLYYYYPNKEAIFDDVVIEEAGKFMAVVRGKLPRDAPPDEKLAAFFMTIYEEMKHYAAETEELPEYLCQHSPHGRPIIEKLSELFKAHIRPILREGMETGVFRIEDEEITIQTLRFMTRYLNLDWMHHNAEPVCDAIVATMIQILLNGLRRYD